MQSRSIFRSAGRSLLTALVLVPCAAGWQDAKTASATMKAVRFHEFGAADVLRYEDAPKPEAKANEVLVRVHAASVNPVDWKIRAGGLKALNPNLPQIPGFDVAGVVESVGADVKRFKVGDEVFSYMSLRHSGAYAEFVAVAENELALKPKKIDFVHAAAVPLAALTAWQALFDTAGLARTSLATPDKAYGLSSMFPPPPGATMPTSVAAADSRQIAAGPYDVGIDFRYENSFFFLSTRWTLNPHTCSPGCG